MPTFTDYDIDSVNYNGNDVQTLIFNGAEVWHKRVAKTTTIRATTQSYSDSTGYYPFVTTTNIGAKCKNITVSVLAIGVPKPTFTYDKETGDIRISGYDSKASTITKVSIKYSI